MKKQILMSLILAGSLVATAAQAEEAATTEQNANTSTVKVSDVQKSEEKKEDIDDEITNARMRAELGSKSLFSFKSALGYNGGSLKKPFDSVRPSYRTSASREAMTSLSGTIGLNYRVSKGGNLSAGTGVVINDPLHGDIGESTFNDPRAGYEGEEVKRSELSTPYLDYSHGYKAYGYQMSSGITYSHYTDEDSTNFSNLIGNVALSQVVIADLGQSKWQGGLSVSLDKEIMKGAFENPLPGILKRYDYGVGLYPFAEYSFNDTFSFRTVFGYFQFAKYEEDDSLVQIEPYQSMGIGISVTRDIYLYPNVQFTPKDMRDDRTNVALSANLNLF